MAEYQSTTNLIPFQFETHAVRVHLDDLGNPWFEAPDACAVLGIKDVSQAVARLRSNQKRPCETRNCLIINESGLYRLIFRSNKPDAEKFQDWVFEVVLPQIRKTGAYSPADKPVVRDPLIQTIIDMAVQLDEARSLAQRADVKSDLALAQQLWLSLREYAHSRRLTHQMPLAVCKAFGTYLSGYCLEHDIPVRDVPIAFKAWKHEHAYHVELIDQLLPKWLKRQAGQITLLPSKA
jgi:prophage antirepressor-like protein